MSSNLTIADLQGENDMEKEEKIIKLLSKILDKLSEISYRQDIIESKVNSLMGVNTKIIR